MRVSDASGKPAAGIPINVKQQRRAFTVGSFVQFSNPTRLLAESPDGERTREIFTRLFNRATCPIYWADWGWPGRKDEFLAIGDWLRQRDMTVRERRQLLPVGKCPSHSCRKEAQKTQKSRGLSSFALASRQRKTGRYFPAPSPSSPGRGMKTTPSFLRLLRLFAAKNSYGQSDCFESEVE